MTPHDKAEHFHTLHQSGCFILANAWDGGSARILAQSGAVALGTTSAGLAFSLGRKDGAGRVSRADAIANAAMIVGASNLPVSADLEDGFGPAPQDCALTVQQAAGAGLCGCTIEDTTGDPADPIHGFEHAVARVRASVAAARATPHRFVLTARAENFLHGKPDLDDTIRRLVAFAELGADCLYAPGLPSMEAIAAVVAAVAPRPVNVMFAPRAGAVPLAELAAAGVRRVSVGGMLARAAYGRLLDTAKLIAGQDLPGLAALGIPGHADLEAFMQ